AYLENLYDELRPRILNKPCLTVLREGEDLAYPDKLVTARKPQTGFEIKEKESVSQFFQPPPLDKQERWFPTLRKTIWVVSQHHDFVKPVIFDDIAQETVSLCRQSRITASDMIRSKGIPSSTAVSHATPASTQPWWCYGNSGFDIKPDDFIITESTVCVAWNTQT
ncbi:hypothetical protein PILCRDRAFT_14741, partial [Piloderma croceum F 1598]